MKIFHRNIILVTALIFMANIVSGQSSEIKIKFIGNCGLYMTDGNLNVYFDFPYKSGAYNYMKYNAAELDSVKDNSIFIFTHRHADHYSKKLVKRLNGKIYGPWAVARKRRLDTGKLNDFSLQAFKTPHRFAHHHNSYLITWHSKKIFISGDTEHAETIEKIKGIDLAFVPTWIMIDAREKSMKIDSKKIALYHLYPNQQVILRSPETTVLLDREGEIISIP